MADVKGGTEDGASTPRRYRSPVRAESARRTRAAVVAAATDLFVAQGYAGTSLAQVARAAGVSRPTVFAAFGSKAGLLRQVLDQALAGDDEPVAVADRPWFRPVWEAGTGEDVLRAYAAICTLIGARAAAVFETVRRAADEADEVAQLWEVLQRNRLAGARMVVGQAASFAPVRGGPDRATEALWILNDPAHYAALVTSRGWPEDAFTRWLADAMVHAVLSAP